MTQRNGHTGPVETGPLHTPRSRSGALPGLARRFIADRSGQFTVMFALSMVMLLTAVGSAFDLGRAYIARQGLDSAATLTCQYSNTPDVVKILQQSNGTDTTTYRTRVSNYLTSALSNQTLISVQSNATPVTYSGAQGAASAVSLSANVPTTLMNVVGVTSVPVSASEPCASGPGTPPADTGGRKLLINEGFENSPCNRAGCKIAYINPDGTFTSDTTPTFGNPSPQSPGPSTPGYTGIGANGDTSVENAWLITGYCLEIDDVGITAQTVPEGTHSAELDCDNGSHTAGNSSISTKVYMVAGTYELRWNYYSRIGNYNFAYSDICGNAASDTVWANDDNYVLDTITNQTFGPRTDQINVYVDQTTADGMPPLHTTLDGTQQLAGVNQIDSCLYSYGWVERVIPITVTTEGYYWVSFAADGASDSFGGEIDYIRLCPGTCSGAYQDDYPSAYLPNGSTYVSLFEDTFENPTYTLTSKSNADGNLNNSVPATNIIGSGGWPTSTCATSWATPCTTTGTGWDVAGTNQLYIVGDAAQGNQAAQVTGSKHRLFSRPFLLVPGYYKLTYDYVADALFSSLGTTVYCGATPSAANISSLGSSASYTNRMSGHSGTLTTDVNIVGVFMSHAQLASTPNPAALNATASYNNTTYTVNADGTSSFSSSTSTTATVPPNGVSLTSYNSSQVNPLLDICGYAGTWQTRTAYIKIIKPAYYWLTFAALGTDAGIGGAIDDVKLTALGSPSMAKPPSGAVTIPVPDPQPGATLSFTGFSIVADQYY